MKSFSALIIVPYLIIVHFSYSQTVTPYQAEDAELYNAIIETEHSGYTGTGYVNYDNALGGYIEWSVYMASSDTQSVDFIYANGSSNNRYLEIRLNDDIVEDSLSFIGTGAWTNWQSQSISVFLNQGKNTIRATAITSDGGPNVDKIDVTGDPGVIYYTLNINTIGNGIVSVDPPGLTYEQGTVVTLTAQPDPSFKFLGWSGDLTGNENPDSLIIDSDKRVSAAFYDPSDTIVTIEDSPVGFATVNALGQDGTYGGEGGVVVYISNAEALDSVFLSRKDPNFNQNYPPMIVMVRGNISGFSNEMMDVKETYDLTILGEGNDAQIEGFGLNIFRSHNIIVRNLEFRDCPDDAINVQDSLSHHIWIDHCTLTDSPAVDISASNHDGLIDIKRGASYITVSWCHFNNHTKTCLLGHSDSNGADDIGKLKTTYHHNWFNDTHSRHPRVRFAECHVYNNFYDGNTLMDYGIASTMDADVLVESNFFLNVPNPIHSGFGSSLPGDVLEINNIYVNSGEPETTGSAFDPTEYYNYEVSNAVMLPEIIPKYAGSGKLDIPVSVNDELTQGNNEITSFSLSQNFPNPFNPRTKIFFELPINSRVIVRVYDILGNEVTTLINEEKDAGSYSVNFDASSLSSGIYFYTLFADNFIQTKKMILIK